MPEAGSSPKKQRAKAAVKGEAQAAEPKRQRAKAAPPRVKKPAKAPRPRASSPEEKLLEGATSLGAFHTDGLGTGEVFAKRDRDRLTVGLRAREGFRLDPATREAAGRARGGNGGSHVPGEVLLAPDTLVRFVVGPRASQGRPVAITRDQTVPIREDLALASFSVSELQELGGGDDVAMYLELWCNNHRGGRSHYFINYQGQPFENFVIPARLLG